MTDALETLGRLSDWVRWGASRFNEHGLVFGHGTDNAIDEALALVLHALHLDHDLPAAYAGGSLTHAERRRVHALIGRRIEERLPLPYLTHRAWFAGLEFYVDERVLIPRSPIAELIEAGFAPWLDPDRVGRVLDLCTGSGCIAIACAAAFPQAEVDASDLSPEALAVAEENRRRHGLEDRLHLYEADLFDGLPPPVPGAGYDLIVSNPPYVDAAEMAALAPEFGHEPRLALAAGMDGLDCVMTILREAGDWLSPDGILVVEVGASQGHLVERLPELPLVWLEFERGGEGVFLLGAEELARCRSLLQAGVPGHPDPENSRGP